MSIRHGGPGACAKGNTSPEQNGGAEITQARLKQQVLGEHSWGRRNSSIRKID